MLVANHEARIVDDAGKDVEVGQPGEIWVRGAVCTKGYYNNPAANKEAFVDGWFCTGDIGLFKNGMFYIVDRKKVRFKDARRDCVLRLTQDFQRSSSSTRAIR